MVGDHVLCGANILMSEIRDVADQIDDYETYLKLSSYTPEWRYKEYAEDRGWEDREIDGVLCIVKVQSEDDALYDAYLDSDYVLARVPGAAEESWRIWFDGEDEDIATGFASKGHALRYMRNEGLIVVPSLSERVEGEAESWQEACEIDGIYVDPVDVYECWVVSDALAYHLREHDMLVEEYLGFTIWGRCCTGQAIALDGDIQDIAEKWYGLEEKAA
jgi:hypothetical protein